MTKQKTPQEWAGEFSSSLLEAMFKEVGLKEVVGALRASESFKSLTEGSLQAARNIPAEIGPHLISSIENMRDNPFYNSPENVAKMLVGTPMLFFYTPGSVASGLITRVASYTGVNRDGEDVGDAPLDRLHRLEPGTTGIWESNRRGGYVVACISAHKPGETGYVALWGVTLGNDKLGMKEVSNKFGFDVPEIRGLSALSNRSQIRVYPNLDSLRGNVQPGYRIAKESPKGKGADCTAIYELVQS